MRRRWMVQTVDNPGETSDFRGEPKGAVPWRFDRSSGRILETGQRGSRVLPESNNDCLHLRTRTGFSSAISVSAVRHDASALPQFSD